MREESAGWEADVKVGERRKVTFMSEEGASGVRSTVEEVTVITLSLGRLRSAPTCHHVSAT